MITSKLLLVVGAGASKEVGLPTGDGLAKTIAGRLNFKFDDFGHRVVSGDPKIFHCLERISRQTGDNINDYVTACRKISSGITLAGSIDQFVHRFESDEKISVCAKLAIVQSILFAEKESTLYISPDYSSNKMEIDLTTNSWFHKFFRIASDGVQRKDVGKIFDNVKIICFNYDRCIEHYFKHALMIGYDLNESDAQSIVDNIDIVHPYGTIGGTAPKGTSPAVSFGNTDFDIIHSYNNIRTFTEQIEDETISNSINEYILSTRKSVFIGFSYGNENMKILDLSHRISSTAPVRNIYGTAFGMSGDDISIVGNRLSSMFAGRVARIVLEPIFCCDLLSNYYKSIGS